jgi:histidine ammonia-lyase
MAHIGLVLIGEGHAHMGGERVSGAEALRRAGLEPLVLEAKEGLSLLNGAPCATGLGALALARADRAIASADGVAALSIEALGWREDAFAQDVLALRKSPGIAATGAPCAHGSTAVARLGAGVRLQDALSLRAVPQVHGAVRDALAHVRTMIDIELASVTDNPVVLGTPMLRVLPPKPMPLRPDWPLRSTR